MWEPKDRRRAGCAWRFPRGGLNVNVSLSVSVSPQTTDDIVSSAECSSDDEDLEECDSGHAGGTGVSSCACSEPGLFLLTSFELLPRSPSS